MPRTLRIAIDLTALLPQETGVDVYLRSLAETLGDIDDRNDYTLVVNAEDLGRLAGLRRSNVRLLPLSLRPRPARLLAQQLLLPLASLGGRFDVTHSPSFLSPHWRAGVAHVLSVHDMTSFTRPEQHIALRGSRAYRMAVRSSIRRAALVLVPSRHTADTLLANVPEADPRRIAIVPYGVREQFRPLPEAEVEQSRARLGLPRRFVLAVGTIEPRKNLARVFEAYRALVARGIDEHLVIVGRLGWQYEDVRALTRDPATAGRVHLLGYVPDEALPEIYNAASAFVYPSLEEGFGFPPLEAMACGVPTLSSDGSALRENLQGAALLVDPASTPDIAAALDRLLRDEALRRDLRAKGRARSAAYRWRNTAAATLDCYRRAATQSVTVESANWPRPLQG